MKNLIFTPLILAYNEGVLKIRNVALIAGDEESVARFLSFYRVSLCHPELSQSRFIVVTALPGARWEPRG